MKTTVNAYLIFLFVTWSSFYVKAQINLVPNSGFSDYSMCPYSDDQVQFCVGWYKCNEGTPDYYNSCSNEFGVPQSIIQYQVDHSTCSNGAYIGIVTYGSLPAPANSREFVGTQFIQPLVIGQKYFLSFYTTLGGASDGNNVAIIGTNNIGIRLSCIANSYVNPKQVDNFAHLKSEMIVSDTINWVRISGSIIADSAYSYLMIGNFYEDNLTKVDSSNCKDCWKYGYYLVDDICVSTDSVLCSSNLTPCTSSTGLNNIRSHFKMYPVPMSDNLQISSSFIEPYDIIIYNSLGQVLYTENNIVSEEKVINTSSFSIGMLLVNIKSKQQSFIFKLLKI